MFFRYRLCCGAASTDRHACRSTLAAWKPPVTGATELLQSSSLLWAIHLR